MHPSQYRLLRTPEAAALLGLSKHTLNKMRIRGDGPPFLRLGDRAVAYDPRDIEAWMQERRRKSTSDLR